MNKGKYFVSLCILGFFCIAFLSGCMTPVPPTLTPEPLKIYFAFPAGYAEYYDDLIEAFNQTHPDITVERRTARTAETWDYLFSEKNVDVFVFSTDSDLFADAYERGDLLSLTPFIQGGAFDLDDFYPSLLTPYSIDGSVWAIPADVNPAVVYYNRDLFDQYGAFYPESGWTWDDLLQAALEIRDPDEDVFGIVASPFFAIPFIYQHGGRVMDDWQSPTRATFDDPLTVEAVQWFADLTHEYDVMPSPQEMGDLYGSNGEPPYLFWRNKAGMYIGWLSDQGGETWGSDWNMSWGVVPMPIDAQASTLAVGNAYSVLAYTAYPDACWEWIVFLCEQMPLYTMPARRSLVESAAYEEMVGPEVAAVARASMENMLFVGGGRAGFDPNMMAFFQALYEIADGNVTALEALTELQRQAEYK